MGRWIGRWLIAVGVVHNLVGIYFFGPAFRGIVLDGVWNAVDMDPGRNLAFWFLFSGFMIMLVGYLTDWIEARGPVPKGLGWSLLAFVLVGVLTMPVSGFWLVIPPIVGILLPSRRSVGSPALGG